VLSRRLSFIVLGRSCNQAGRRGLCRLSRIGMNQLITDGAVGQTERNSKTPGLFSSDGVGAVLMLPQLENILQRAVEDLQHCSTQSSHGVSATCSSRGSVDSGSSMLGLGEETVAALQQLLALVHYSRHARQAITTFHDESDAVSKADHVISVQVDG